LIYIAKSAFQISREDISYFKGIIKTPHGVIEGTLEELAFYNQDWTKKYCGQSQLVLRPNNATQVSEILKYCNEQKLAIVPQGGNTGLVGGSVPVFDEIILSLGRLDKIISLDKVSGVVTVEAGCILETVERYVGQHEHTMPIDLGAKGSCQIGGNLATNAGGIRLIRYGSPHGNVTGMQIVLADGTIIDNLTNNRKDNTGIYF